jgi:hypothetical protein
MGSKQDEFFEESGNLMSNDKCRQSVIEMQKKKHDAKSQETAASSGLA